MNALSRFFASENLFGTSILNWNEVEMPGNLGIPLRGQFGIAGTSKQDVRCEIIEDNYHALTEQELGETVISLDTSKE